MQVQPYLFFGGNCEEALEFYKKALGAEVQVMASDGCPQEGAGFKNFSLTISAANEADTDRLFNALTNGGQVQMPLGKTFFSPRFGMVTDKFGLCWMVGVFEQSAQAAA